MWTYQKALSVIKTYVVAASDGVAVILEDKTLDLPYGWVFFYQSREYQTGDTTNMLVGNAQLIFNRVSGEIRVTGTAMPIEDYLREYEAGLSPIELTMRPERRARGFTG